MKILGNRVLVSKLEEEKKEGFQTVEVQDNFVYKGKVEKLGELGISQTTFSIGSIIIFSKYSPDTHEIDYEGKKMKIVEAKDILAIL